MSEPNRWVDIFGLQLHHIIPQAVWKNINRTYNNALKNLNGYVQNVTKKALDKSNLKELPTPFHGNHPAYNKYVQEELVKLIGDDGILSLSSVKDLQKNLID